MVFICQQTETETGTAENGLELGPKFLRFYLPKSKRAKTLRIGADSPLVFGKTCELELATAESRPAKTTYRISWQASENGQSQRSAASRKWRFVKYFRTVSDRQGPGLVPRSNGKRSRGGWRLEGGGSSRLLFNEFRKFLAAASHACEWL